MSANETYVKGIIDRYIYAVAKRLPRSQREDIKRELRGLIDDLLAERCGDNEPTPKDIDEVLIGLGAPELLAEKYNQEPRYIIGPEYYESYRYLLTLVLSCVAFGMTIAHGILAVISPQESPLALLGNYAMSLYFALLQVFAFVTISFIISDYVGRRKNKQKAKENWYPNMLPELPEAVKGIKKSEPIAGIVFTVLVIILFNAAPWLMGVHHFSNGWQSVPVFNLDYLKTVVIWFNICFILGIIREIVRLVIGKYTISLSVITSLLNVASLAIIIPFLNSPQLWNQNIASDLASIRIIDAGFDLAALLDIFIKFFVAVFIFAFLLDTITVIVKTIKAQRSAY